MDYSFKKKVAVIRQFQVETAREILAVEPELTPAELGLKCGLATWRAREILKQIEAELAAEVQAGG